MKIDQAKQIAAKTIEELSQALEAGHSEKLREYLGAVARFHRRPWRKCRSERFRAITNAQRTKIANQVISSTSDGTADILPIAMAKPNKERPKMVVDPWLSLFGIGKKRGSPVTLLTASSLMALLVKFCSVKQGFAGSR